MFGCFILSGCNQWFVWAIYNQCQLTFQASFESLSTHNIDDAYVNLIVRGFRMRTSFLPISDFIPCCAIKAIKTNKEPQEQEGMQDITDSSAVEITAVWDQWHEIQQICEEMDD